MSHGSKHLNQLQYITLLVHIFKSAEKSQSFRVVFPSASGCTIFLFSVWLHWFFVVVGLGVGGLIISDCVGRGVR